MCTQRDNKITAIAILILTFTIWFKYCDSCILNYHLSCVFWSNCITTKKISRNHNLPSSIYPQLKRISKNARQASWLSSSLPISFFSNGCFSGSLEYRHSSSGFLLRAVDNTLLRMPFGRGLQTKVNCLIRLNCH